MLDFFTNLYRWFDLIPFYSRDLGEHLRGYDFTCSGFFGSPLYIYTGWALLILTAAFYALLYHIINSQQFNKRRHWWMMAAALFVLNFFIAFILPFKDLQAGEYCNQLNISTADCIGFGLSNGLWSFILFTLITSLPYPRAFAGYNTTETTFWKPKS